MLRSGGRFEPEYKENNQGILYEMEAKYWGVYQLPMEKRIFTQECMQFFSAEPTNSLGLALDKWKKLGSIDLVEFVKQQESLYDLTTGLTFKVDPGVKNDFCMG